MLKVALTVALTVALALHCVPLRATSCPIVAKPLSSKYGVTDVDIKEFLILIEERSGHVFISGDVSICRDKDDDLIIETAIKGKAKYLVTRDDDVKMDKKVSDFLSQSGVFPISVARFLKLITLRS